MIESLQRLPADEEKMWVELAHDNGMAQSELACVMTRQQGEGSFISKSKGMFQGERCGISYDLYLCHFCGNFEPRAVCPGKVLIIKDRLLNA